MITDHVWRPPPHNNGRRNAPCMFMNCRRPIAEHERAVLSGRRAPRRLTTRKRSSR